VAVVADRGGDGARLYAEARDEGAADVAGLAVALDDADLGDIVRRVGRPLVARRRHRLDDAVGNDAAGGDTNHHQFARPARYLEIVRADFAELDAVQADRGHDAARQEQLVVDDAARRNHGLHVTLRQIAHQHDVGAAAGRHESAVAEAEGVGRRPARRAIDMMQRPAELDQRADHVVEVALLGDVERVAVVGAEATEA